MEKYIYDESNGLWYELNGDYYLPCFTLPEVETKEIGVWGMRHLDYLKSHRKATFFVLAISFFSFKESYYIRKDRSNVRGERFSWNCAFSVPISKH